MPDEVPMLRGMRLTGSQAIRGALAPCIAFATVACFTPDSSLLIDDDDTDTSSASDTISESDATSEPDTTSTASGSTTTPSGTSANPSAGAAESSSSGDEGETASADDSSTTGSASDCEPSVHESCDAGDPDPFAAMGLGCPGEVRVQSSTMGRPQSMGVRSSFGPSDTWSPREGDAFAVIGSGSVTDLDMATPTTDNDFDPTHCNDGISDSRSMSTLPDPIGTTGVAGDCAMDETLVGTGDCSNTIEGPFSQGGAAHDYVELRLVTTVPPSSTSLSYDLAFLSTEYPAYYGQIFNDMYIGWLESERWTGNISFDGDDQPISLNSGFVDFRDDGGAVVPEFEGTCMQRHGGTPWLNSVAPVTPGETITLVMAVFDLADGGLDSYVFLDNFSWGCEDIDTPATTRTN